MMLPTTTLIQSFVLLSLLQSLFAFHSSFAGRIVSRNKDAPSSFETIRHCGGLGVVVVSAQRRCSARRDVDNDDDDDDDDGEGSSSVVADFESLQDTDVILFSRVDEDATEQKVEIGAVQEDGTLAPLSAWTLDSVFPGSDTLELVVDEEDRHPGLNGSQIRIVKVLEDGDVGYGSRQVGGGKGPGNPHGEESETLYYVERGALSVPDSSSSSSSAREVELVLKPELETLW